LYDNLDNFYRNLGAVMINPISAIGVVSLKIGQAPIEIIEAFTVPSEKRPDILVEVKRALRVEGLLYLATCNRVEFWVCLTDDQKIIDMRNGLIDFFFKGRETADRRGLEPSCFHLETGRDAVRHIFSVAASLDSVVVGEAQILGQVKEAYKQSQDWDLNDSVLDSVMAAAFNVAKRVRTETDLGRKAVSMASLVSERMERILAEMPEMQIALVGTGPMCVKMAEIIRKKYDSPLIFVNRTASKAEQLAEKYSGRAVTLKDFLEGRHPVDIIISSTSSPEPLFSTHNIDNLIAPGGHLYAFDLAIPRDFAADLASDRRLFYWDIERLNERSQENRRERFRVADQARKIIDDQAVAFVKKEIAQMISPLFYASLSETSSSAEEGLEELFRKKLGHLSEEDRQILHYWSRKLVSRACFAPAKILADQIVETDLEDCLELATLFRGQKRLAAAH